MATRRDEIASIEPFDESRRKPWPIVLNAERDEAVARGQVRPHDDARSRLVVVLNRVGDEVPKNLGNRSRRGEDERIHVDVELEDAAPLVKDLLEADATLFTRKDAGDFDGSQIARPNARRSTQVEQTRNEARELLIRAARPLDEVARVGREFGRMVLHKNGQQHLRSPNGFFEIVADEESERFQRLVRAAKPRIILIERVQS